MVPGHIWGHWRFQVGARARRMQFDSRVCTQTTRRKIWRCTRYCERLSWKLSCHFSFSIPLVKHACTGEGIHGFCTVPCRPYIKQKSKHGRNSGRPSVQRGGRGGGGGVSRANFKTAFKARRETRFGDSAAMPSNEDQRPPMRLNGTLVFRGPCLANEESEA